MLHILLAGHYPDKIDIERGERRGIESSSAVETSDP